MKKSHFLLCLAALFSVGSDLLASDLPSVNRKSILEELERIEVTRREKWSAGFKSVIDEIAKAAESPSAAEKLYETAIRQVHVDGTGGQADRLGRLRRDEQQGKEAGEIDERLLREGLQVRLRYMVLILRLAAGEESDDLLPSLEVLVEYIRALDEKTKGDFYQKWPKTAHQRDRGGIARGERFWGLPFVTKGDKQRASRAVARGEMQWDPILANFQIDSMLTRLVAWEPDMEWFVLKGWPMTLTNLDSIEDRLLAPFFRAQFKAEAKGKETFRDKLIALREARIERAEKATDEGDLAFAKDRFKTETLPRLMWDCAKEYAQVGEPNRAISEMFALIRQNPGHPDFDGWVDQLRGLLQQ